MITVGVSMEGWIEFKSSAAETSLAQANDEALAAERSRTAKLEVRAAELLAQIQPRELTSEQRSAIASAVKDFAGSTPSIRYTAGDGESQRLALELNAALAVNLESARRNPPLPMSVSLPLIFGIQLEMPSTAALPPQQRKSADRERAFAQALRLMLINEGRLVVAPLREHGDCCMNILVGVKPVGVSPPAK